MKSKIWTHKNQEKKLTEENGNSCLFSANSENDKDLAQNQFSNIIEQLRKVNSVYRHPNRTDIDIECAANCGNGCTRSSSYGEQTTK